ncbi:hypothetical protein AB0N06_36070 [Streptomyces sp. NPDC051020]|uniref:hypothetical protein n=1 Tax=Streptomyces sp. NPDC051020 TaxID=3155409 RepID=UPI00343AA2A4
MTLHQNGHWRRQMARTRDDLTDDLTRAADVEPRSTGEVMALHVGSARARALERNRPQLARKAVAGLPEDRRDDDWDACSGILFQDHDVLMLFDDALDGVEDSGSAVNLAPLDWFTAFDPDLARDPDRGFPHP